MGEWLDRRLAAVMFTDMVGYTALMQADERLGIDKRDRYMRALESHHDAFGGMIVQRLGDGSMSMFPGSLAAVLAAVAIQRELAAQDVLVRIGKTQPGHPGPARQRGTAFARWVLILGLGPGIRQLIE
jgi:adenylate cyclase